MPTSFLRIVISLSLLGATLLVGCGKPRTTRAQSDPNTEVPSSRDFSSPATRRPGTVEERRAAFLNRIRASDPNKATIERAVINGNNELGLILSRTTNLDDVSKLLKAMLVQMNESFPGQDLTVIAYAPTNPPRTIGTARLDSRTRDVTYEPASGR